MTLGAGARGVIHPGGSMRSEEALAADGERITTMVFTRTWHFRH